MTDHSFDRDTAEAAMCMWEYVLEPDTAISEHVAGWRDANGTGWLRSTILHLAPAADEAYRAACQFGYDGPFDWDFIPWFMQNCVVWDHSIYGICLAPAWEAEVLLLVNHQRD